MSGLNSIWPLHAWALIGGESLSRLCWQSTHELSIVGDNGGGETLPVHVCVAIMCMGIKGGIYSKFVLPYLIRHRLRLANHVWVTSTLHSYG